MHVLIIPSEHFRVKAHPLAGIFQYDQAKALKEAGNCVGVISVGYISLRYFFQKYSYSKYEIHEGLNIYRRYRRSFRLERFSDPYVAARRHWKLFQKLYDAYEARHGRPDIIHAHNFLFAGAIARLISEKCGIPYVVTEHSSAFARGFVSDYCSPLLRSIAEKAAALSCVSSSFQKILQDRIKLPFAVLPNIVDAIFFEKPVTLARYDDFTFLNVASLDENKNHVFLLHTFSEKFRGLNVRLRIVGEGALRPILEELTKELGIRRQVSFLGRLHRSAVRDEMYRANCFVLPSKYETFGVVLSEALACGIPLIATRCGGPEDIVNQGNGMLVDVDSSEQLGFALNHMLKNSAQYDRELLSNEAHARFSNKAFVKNATTLYNKSAYP